MTPHDGPARELADLRVLVVDDSATNRMILREQLALWQVACDLCEDAESAWPVLRAAASAGRPYDLVLLDLAMPGMDGIELARRMAQDASLAGTTTLLLSSLGAVPQRRLDEVAIGGCLLKPVSDEDLLDAVLRLTGAVEGPPTAPGPVPTLPHPEVLDLEQLTSLRELGPADGWGILPSVADVFLTPLPQRRAELRRAVGDPATLAGLLHSLRGAASTLGLRQVAQTCARLERQLSAGQAVGAAELDELDAVLRVGVAALQDVLRRRPT